MCWNPTNHKELSLLLPEIRKKNDYMLIYLPTLKIVIQVKPARTKKHNENENWELIRGPTVQQ